MANRMILNETAWFGRGAVGALTDEVKRRGYQKALIVTDKTLVQCGVVAKVTDKMDAAGLAWAIYDGVVPNPTITVVKEGLGVFQNSGADYLIAIGGGSPIDAAKVAAARVVRPDKTVAQLGGLLKVRRPLPLFIAVPTTAGTGSEATIAAVVTGEEHRKYAVSDLCLIPRYAVLDPTLTLSLPPAVTAQTGMDALTHAVEAYLSLYYNTRETRALAESAVRDIFRYLPVACRDGQSLTARERMLRASFDAGCAFTRASVGNVHAIAHTLGGLYGIPHGLACAVTLPVVLEDYGAAVHPHLARLGSLIGLTGTEQERAVGFLAAIRALNASLGIPDRFDGIRGEDLPRMAAWAAAEANPVYPVPVVYDQARFRRVLERLRA